MSNIRYLTEEERRAVERRLIELNKKIERRSRITQSISNTLKYIFFKPLSIATMIISVVAKFCGFILALGMPYGLYCLYKVIEQIINNQPLGEENYVLFVLLFVLSPFIAYALNFLFEKLSDFFSDNS